MSDTLFPVPSVRVSARWLATRLNCTLEGIIGAEGCGGGCCYSDKYWPPAASGIEDTFRGKPVYRCAHLEPGVGCRLGEQRPLKCQLYPLELTTEHLTRRWHSTLPHSLCAANHGHGPTIVEAMEEGLRRVLPAATVDAILLAVECGVDISIELPEHVAEAIAREDAWEAAMVTPEPTEWPDPNA